MKRLLSKWTLTILFLALTAVYSEAATVSGKVLFDGPAPAPKPINFGAEKQCATMHGDKMPVSEDVVVNANNTLRWTLVYVKDGANGEFKAPDQEYLIDQMGCVFLPHVSAVMKGQKVVFKNSDPVLHNVRTASKVNKTFNIAQPVKDMKTNKVFAEAETGIQLRCDVHFWMVSYLHVLNNPYFAVTGEDGSFELNDLPAGTYTIGLWHEKLGEQTQTITITDGDTKEINFTVKPSA